MIRKLYNYLNDKIYLFAIISKIILILAGIIVNALQTRFFGKYYKGIYSYISNILSILVIITVFGIHQLYPYYRKEKGKKFAKTYYGAVQFLLLVYIMLAVFFCIIFGYDNIYAIVAILTPIMFYSKIVSYSAMVEKPGIKNVVELFVNLIDIIIIILFYVLLEPNLLCMFIIISVNHIAYILIYGKIQNIKLCISRDSFQLIKEMAMLGFFPMLSLLMTNLNYRIDVFMLKRFVSLEDIGVYSTGVSLVEQCWVIPETIRDILVSKLVNGKNEDEVAKVTRISNLIVCIEAIFLILFGKYVIIILFGKEFVMAYSVVIIEIFGVLGMVSMKMIAAYNTVINKQRTNFCFLLIGIVINAIMNIVFIPLLGINGAAMATLISYTVNGIIFNVYFAKKSKCSLGNILLINKNDLHEGIKEINKLWLLIKKFLRRNNKK